MSASFRSIRKDDLQAVSSWLLDKYYSYFDEDLQIYQARPLLPSAKDLEQLILSNKKIDAIKLTNEVDFLIYQLSKKVYNIFYHGGNHFLDWAKKKVIAGKLTKLTYNVPDYCISLQLELKKEGFKADKKMLKNFKGNTDFYHFTFERSS